MAKKDEVLYKYEVYEAVIDYTKVRNVVISSDVFNWSGSITGYYYPESLNCNKVSFRDFPASSGTPSSPYYQFAEVALEHAGYANTLYDSYGYDTDGHILYVEYTFGVLDAQVLKQVIRPECVWKKTSKKLGTVIAPDRTYPDNDYVVSEDGKSAKWYVKVGEAGTDGVYVNYKGKVREVTEMYVNYKGKVREVSELYVNYKGKVKKVF